ncbi:unnamed protein product [Symbiodinium microadriaticum]|nr:unnamed protein product [Symbiodinium microadriaticum]CAE7338740.1 unnamed protein product [Symbiodinium sp. KB8]
MATNVCSQTVPPRQLSSQDADALRSRNSTKIAFVDQAISRGEALGSLGKLDAAVWEEALNKHRLQAARVGIAIRPQTFSKPDRGAEEVAEEQSSTASPDQKADLTPLKRMYVRTEKGVRGVFEICLVPEENSIEGYRCIWRCSDVWELQRKGVSFKRTMWQNRGA